MRNSLPIQVSDRGSKTMTTRFHSSLGRVRRLLLLALAPVLVNSCTELTEVPKDALTPDNAFKTEEEILAGVASVYAGLRDRKSTRLNSSHLVVSYAVFCLETTH